MKRFATMVLGFAIGAVAVQSGTYAQPAPRTLRDDLVGPWRLVSIINLRADGTKYELFGPNATGMLIFDKAGTYSFQIMRAHRPLLVAENRLEGTPEENRATAQGVLSHFGTYEVNEGSHSFTLHIECSSYPNWEKTEQKRNFTILADRLSWTDAAAGPRPGDLQSDLIWKRVQ
jgi:Fe-S cluster biosynthesis and repair protein YggX